jgi:uncharacterized protein YcbX
LDAVVRGIFVYPVKSCRGIALDRAEVEPRGLRYDRRFMIVDGTGTFVTQRTEPRLTGIEVTLDEERGSLMLSASGCSVLRLALTPREGERVKVQVWRDEVDALHAGEEAARWVSVFLGAPASLVFMPDAVERPVRPDLARVGDHVSFADAFPMLVTTTDSLDDLNARLDRPLPMNRFRPNVVVSGCTPWEEDHWQRARIGVVPLRLPKACDRCVVTTTDQITGERGVEPLRTMATFRKWADSKVYFGVNAVPDARGTIAVGDRVTVLE